MGDSSFILCLRNKLEGRRIVLYMIRAGVSPARDTEEVGACDYNEENSDMSLSYTSQTTNCAVINIFTTL